MHSKHHKPSRRIAEVAAARPGLASLVREAEAYLALNRRLAEQVPECADGQIGVACIEGDCLVIAAASPARATRARLAADTMLEAARAAWPRPLTRTRVIVTPGIEFGR